MVVAGVVIAVLNVAVTVKVVLVLLLVLLWWCLLQSWWWLWLIHC